MILKSGSGDHQREITLFFPVNRMPPVNDQIFNIQTATASQCRYACLHDGECLLVKYGGAGSQCTGYKSDAEHTILGETVKAWKVVHSGSLIFYIRYVYLSQTITHIDQIHYTIKIENINIYLLMLYRRYQGLASDPNDNSLIEIGRYIFRV